MNRSHIAFIMVPFGSVVTDLPTLSPKAPEIQLAVDLRNEFRSLIMLLTLTVAINNNGHAILRYETGEVY